MKITVVGSGYVGTSNAVLLSQYNEVVLLDLSKEKVDKINSKTSPIEDAYIDDFLQNKQLNLRATIDKRDAYSGAEYIIVAVPTDYNTETKFFNTSLIEKVLGDIQKISPASTVVIKSTIPVGYVKSLEDKYFLNIMFSPEFLREGTALKDNLYPDRIVIGYDFEKNESKAKKFGELLSQGAIKKDIPIVYTSTTEAEAIKLFANSYLAMRVAYFNELDSYALKYNLNTKDIIQGVCLDHRIGNQYNNPSFGYGGYCYPKDTKQLLANYQDVPQNLISAIVQSNKTRKSVITEKVLSRNPGTVGIFRLTMKSNSDNFRSSAIQDIIISLQKQNINIIIYEPSFEDTNWNGIPVVNNLEDFSDMCDVIIANRIEPELEQIDKYKEKVFTRDIFNTDS